MTSDGSKSQHEQPPTKQGSPVESAFSSLAALFEQSLQNVQLSAEGRDLLARAFDEQIGSLFKTLDLSSLGTSTLLPLILSCLQLVCTEQRERNMEYPAPMRNRTAIVMQLLVHSTT